MRLLTLLFNGAFLIFTAGAALGAGTNGEQWQMITLPADVTASHFADLEGKGRSDLLAVEPEKLLIYRQRAWGFTNVPDQVIGLPPQTAWVAPCDVDAHPGLELLISTGTGLVYHRQNGGLFESESRTLFKADQVFTNADSARLVSLGTNAPIPLISATQVSLCERIVGFVWNQGRPDKFEVKHSSWSAERNDWSLGPNASRSMQIYQAIRSNPTNVSNEKPENDAIRKLLEEMKKAGPWHEPSQKRVDINGDGKKDLILWQVLGDIEARTDIYIFICGEDGKLPERPTQILHCRGFPIPYGDSQVASPIAALKGNGEFQLVLLEMKSVIVSAGGLVEMVLSRGVDFSLTIRTFNHGAFSRSSDATVPVTAILSMESLEAWPFFISGDFNGDGRPDLVVQRNSTQWNVFYSTNDGHWFAPQPAMTFDTPMPGYFEIQDLNGDGRADLVLRAKDDPRICILFSPSQQMKGTR